MTSIHQIWKCEICGNIVEILHEGADSLVCCGQPMILQKENTIDASKEKHVPVIEKLEEESKIIVKIGEIGHPMEDAHYIEWIELIDLRNNKTFKEFLKPGMKPEAEFSFENLPEKIEVRAYCNLHGLWKSNK